MKDTKSEAAADGRGLLRHARKRSTAGRDRSARSSVRRTAEATSRVRTHEVTERPRLSTKSGALKQGNAVLQTVLLEQIDERDMTYQFRFSTRVDRDLKESLELVGQLDPVDLLGPKPYRILQGHRRIAAARELGKSTIEAIVHTGLRPSESWAIGFAKNVVRKDLTALERANTIQLGLKSGESKTHLGNLLGISERQVNRDLELLNYPAHIQEVLDGTVVKTAHARVLVQFEVSDAKKWRKRIEDEKLDARALKKVLAKEKRIRRGGRTPKYVAFEGADTLRVYAFRIRRNASSDHLRAAAEALEKALTWLRHADRNRNVT